MFGNFSFPAERRTYYWGIICHMWRNRHGLWKQKAVSNDAKLEALINKCGLDSCVVPQYCQPLYICEASFKIHLSCADV